MHLLGGIVLTIVMLATASNVNDQLHCSSSEPSCYHQLEHLNTKKEDCFIRRINPSSPECKNLRLHTGNTGSIGHVFLHHYLFVMDNSAYFTTGLNATFSNVKWTRLRLQFKERTNESSNFCREINLNSKMRIPENVTLFYDCLWSIDLEDKEFDFKYEIFDMRTKSIAGRHYIFKVPRHYKMLPDRPIKTWPVFMYLDITDLPTLILRWETLRKLLDFNIVVYINDQPVKNVRISSSQDKQGQFSYSYYIGFNSGKIHFTVEAVHKECNGKCEVFKSPAINVENISNRPLLLGIVGSVVLLPVFLYSLYVWKRCTVLAVDKVPIVLLVYRRSFGCHTRAVIAFAKYLREFCRVNALLDELDIPLTKSKDPHEWYQESFCQATAVLVISSPPCNDPLESGIYQKVDVLALRILSEKLCDPNNKQKYFSLVLPYCSHEDIPTEARNFRHYSFKKDFNELLWHLRFGFKYYCASKIDYMCYHSQIPGGDSDLLFHGKFLLDALQAAEEDMKKRALLSRKINEDNFEQIPLQDVITSENTDNFEGSESFLWLNSYVSDMESDKRNSYSEFPGNIENFDLLGLENSPSTSSEQPCKIDLHQLDLNKLAL